MGCFEVCEPFNHISFWWSYFRSVCALGVLWDLSSGFFWWNVCTCSHTSFTGLLTEPTDVSKEDTQNSLSLQDSTDPSLGAGHNQEEGTGRCGLELFVTLRAVHHALSTCHVLLSMLLHFWQCLAFQLKSLCFNEANVK